MLASQRVIDMSHDKIPVGRSCCNIICWPICYLHVALRKIANGRTKMLHGYNLLQGEVWIYYQAFGADVLFLNQKPCSNSYILASRRCFVPSGE
ncbi:unnamed protein product [Rhodiola kirilowii]